MPDVYDPVSTSAPYGSVPAFDTVTLSRTDLLSALWDYANTAPPPPRYVSADHAARYLGVSVRTVETLTSAGKLTALYLGGARRYDLRVLESYAATCTKRPGKKRGPKPGTSRRSRSAQPNERL